MPKKQQLKIYFAGSLRGSIVWSDLFIQLTEYLKQYGEVLTEHALLALKNQQKYNLHVTKQDIFETDKEFLQKANIMIAEVSAPSHGVGRELCYAAEVRKIPVLALYLTSTELSAVIEGNTSITKKGYNGIEECKEIIKDYFSTNL